MDMNVDLGAVERVGGLRGWVGYLAGAAGGAMVALSLLALVFGISLPLL
jgi:hypothetical protein